jgi:thiosulfate/3-mercaptopyruvate sulfurtransferase
MVDLNELTPLITPAELHAHLADPRLRIVDCRFLLPKPEQGLADYQQAHLPGAVYAHLDRDLSSPVVPGATGRHPLPTPEALAERLGQWGISNDSYVVVYDNQDGSMAAARLWWLLRWLGHDAVAVLNGGLSAWQKRGLPTETATPASTSALFVASPRAELAVSRNDIAQALDNPRLTLLDARAGERFRGEIEPIDKRAGHIPGARSLPLAELVSDGQLRPPDALRQRILTALGDTPPAEAVAYCGSGVTACHLLLAAEAAGLEGIRLFPGSWSEWISDDRLPIAVGP